MRNVPHEPQAPADFESLSIVDYLFTLLPGEPCPVTALYRSSCDCRTERVVPTGAACPPCLRCGKTGEWDFVRIGDLTDAERRLSA